MSTHFSSTLTCTERLTRHTPVGALPELALDAGQAHLVVPLGRIACRALFAFFPPHHFDSGAWIPVTGPG